MSACNCCYLLPWTYPTAIQLGKLHSASSFVSRCSNNHHRAYPPILPSQHCCYSCQPERIPGFKQAHFTTMACTQDHNGTSASPNSSEEIESHHATPATKLSPFSPDQISDEPKHISQGIVRTRVPPPFVLARDQSNFSPNGKSGNSLVPGSQDPFLSVSYLSSNTQSSGDGSKLSPSALAFTPTSFIESASSNGNSGSSAFQYPLSAPNSGIIPRNLDFFAPKPRSNNLQCGPGGKKCVLPSPDSSFGTPIFNVGSIKLGQFSTDVSKSRSLMAGPVTRVTSAKEIETLLGVSLVDIQYQ